MNLIKKIIYLLLISCTLISCKEEKEELTQKKETKDNIINTNTLEATQTTNHTNENQSETIPTHIFTSGETLWDLSKSWYGNRHYASILAIYNKIKNVNTIKGGTIIKRPTLQILLMDEELNLAPVISKEINDILAARSLFMKHEKTLGDMRKNVEGRTPLILPKNIEEDLQNAKQLIDQSITSLSKLQLSTITIPKSVITQLKATSRNLNNLSLGEHDGVYKYDLDMVHQRIILAFKNTIKWAQNNYQ